MLPPGLATSEDTLRRIHETALRILAETGIRTGHPAMRARLLDLGCREASGRITIPPEIVAATLENTPASFDLYGRTPEQKITVGFERTHGVNTGIFPNIIDFETGQARRSVTADVAATTRLLDAMDNVHAIYVSLVDATEVPPHMITAVDFATVLANTTKPLVGPGLTNRREAEVIVALARAQRGGDPEALRRYPNCLPFVCPVSPLFFPAEVVDALEVIAAAGLPLDALPNPVMGLTSPYTLAGTVALGHAEVLATVVMASTITPGLPILNQNTPSVADMRTLISTTGGPETGLIRQMAMLLSQYLQIPGCAHGHTSSARLDFQAGEEKALNNLLIAAARPSLLGGLGALANVTVTSYETIVLDNERYGAIFRMLRGVQADDHTLDFDALNAGILEGGFLSSEQTMKYLRSNEVWKPRLSVRQGLIEGQPGADTSVARARAEAARLLAGHTVAPLPDEVQSELDRIIASYRAAAAV